VRTLRQFLSVIVLTLMLVTAANAGDMHTTIATPPGSTIATTDGDIHTMRAGDISTMGADAAAADDSLTSAALSLLRSVLSLF
jgi:hypothetical protein